MKQTIWSRLFLGSIMVAVVACRPVTEENGNLSATEDVSVVTRSSIISQQATATNDDQGDATQLPPPEPTPIPTTTVSLQQIGSEASGLQIAVPPEWVNLTGDLDTPLAVNSLGLVVLLAADSERAGSALLANKQIDTGAYAAGLVTNLDLPGSSPSTALTALLENYDVSPIGVPNMIETASSVSADIPGAFIDIEGAPLIFNNGSDNLRTRIYLFTINPGSTLVSLPTQAVFLFTAESDQWASHIDTFDEIAETIIIHDIFANIQINDGTTSILGSLGEQDLINGRLESGISDIWTFNSENGRYATITANPEDTNLDLTMSLISPSGQTISTIDNGFAGDTEVVIDLLLPESGTYLIEIEEFFNAGGRYTLSLVLTDDPLFNNGGRIELGQTIQSDLPAEGKKVWQFIGTANDLVSIVLIPEGPFDAILELYSPDGIRLVGLDEGFSGDAEVISGYELPLTGEYTIIISSFAGDGGGYSLSLDEGGEDTANFHDAGDLIYGDVKQESLQANEAHAWFFNGTKDDEVEITITPLNSALDLNIWLLDPNVERLTTQDKHPAGEQERVTFTLPQDGQYLILVSEFFGTAGDYEIELAANEINEPTYAGLLEYDDPVSGRLAAEQSNLWLFDAKKGDLLDIMLTTTRSNRDLSFYIQGPDGNRVLTVDNTDAGEDEAFLMFSIGSDGQWGIVIEEFYGDAAPYSLTVTRSKR
ncbi:MAG: hypothetical protein DWQ04_33730 [Chloroflexi bacterium]|nr:MAG: hypothetical protein DWQ04_33730 [Chloroflexota bacterium]